MHQWITLLTVIFLAGCSSPPEPPVVSGSDRQAVNQAEKVERTAQSIPLENKFQKQQPWSTISPSVLRPITPPFRSQTISIHFPFNNTKFQLSDAESKKLFPLLAKAHRIEVRGRTDGQRPSAADEKIALSRALAAQRYLIGQGVSPALISVNYLSAGDYVGDNYSGVGRVQNRRVDIEVFTE